ncbi:uncharacterized protein VP01_12421g2, partial [Puccinia sorghi]
PSPSLSTEPVVLAKSFVGQISLHTVTYSEQFPTNSSKVAFAVLFMTDYAATWSQPYLMKVFNAEEVALDKFLDNFNCPKVPPPNWNSVSLHAGVQLTHLNGWVGRHPTDESLPARTEGKHPTCRGNKQHPVHLSGDYASNGPESRPGN